MLKYLFQSGNLLPTTLNRSWIKCSASYTENDKAYIATGGGSDTMVDLKTELSLWDGCSGCLLHAKAITFYAKSLN